MFLHEIMKGADPSHLAFTGEVDVTYGALEDAIHRYRNAIYALGVREGERVSLYSANRAEFVYAFMAVVSLGAIIVPVNNSLVDREVDYILKDSGSTLLITDTPMDVSVPSISIEELDEKSHEPLPEAPDFPASLTEDDVCALIYTSGTTGSPKGAMLTHKNLVRNVEQFTARIIFKPEDKVLCVLPMFHCYGMTTIVHGSLYAHSTIVILRSRTPLIDASASSAVSSALPAALSIRKGSFTVNAVPSPLWLVKEMLPPMVSVSFFAIGMPSPVPL